MAVGISLGNITDEVGSAAFFHAFFSTISGNLEPQGWGSRFPVILTDLYQGELPQTKAGKAIEELDTIKAELSKLSPSHVIWDIEDRSVQPPWKSNTSSDIRNLGNYFVTSTGRDLFDLLYEIIGELRAEGGIIKVVNC